MEPEVEVEGRRQDVMVSRGGGIPEDIVAIIISYLPLKSLGRFKAVSKAWCLLIISLNLPPFFLGLFYTIFRQRRMNSSSFSFSKGEDTFKCIVSSGGNKAKGIIIDPALSFLPNAPDSITRLLDCCNGLLLLRKYRSLRDTFYICNPLTKSWTQLYDLDWEFCRLHFDPKVSPNFKVVTFPNPTHLGHKFLNIRLLSSENNPSMLWKHYDPVIFRDAYHDESYVLMSSHMYKHHALWGESLYLLFGINPLIFGDAGRIMRFDLLEYHVAGPQLIELPKGTKKPSNVAIGRSRNKLCLGGLDLIVNNNNNNNQMVLRLRVWSLSNRYQTVWVMEHDNIITSSHLLCPPAPDHLRESPYIGQFHPILDVVFILYRNMVYAYDLKNLSLNEVCHIGSNKQIVVHASLFPFLPSMADYSDYSTQSEAKHKRKFSPCPRGLRRRVSVKPCNY